MIIELTDTNASGIAAALVQARRHAGSPTMGMVLTLVVVADETNHYDAMKAANQAAREHPSRLVGVIARGGRGPARVDAEVRVGGDAGPGESVLLRLYGQLAQNAESVVTPLLLPESPVVVWWPGKSPALPAGDPLGRLAQRRVTDAAAERRPLQMLIDRCADHHPGDTDLTWTRITPWRALLASALDQDHATIEGATIDAERGNASADLLAAWLDDRLGVPIKVTNTRGPGITAARLHTTAGDIAITRPDGRIAHYDVPGQPTRSVALARRPTSELLAEELRYLDADAVYNRTVNALIRRRERQPATRRARGAEPAAEASSGAGKATKKAASTTKTGTTKKTAAKKTAPKTASTKAAGTKTTAAKKTGATTTGTGTGTGTTKSAAKKTNATKRSR